MNRLGACALFALCCLPSPAPAAEAPAPALDRAAFESFTKEILGTSKRNSAAEGPVARDLEIPPGSKAWDAWMDAAQSPDGLSRKTLVFVEASTRTARAFCVVFFARKDDAKGKIAERLWLKLSLDGRLEKARLVRGSGKPELLDVRAAAVRKLAQREFDRWTGCPAAPEAPRPPFSRCR